MSKCEKGIHKFQARYDRVLPKWFDTVTELSGGVGGYFEDVYVRDICVKCGKVIER